MGASATFPPEERRTPSPSGTGIIKYGNVCIPFDNRMSKEENPIYALFNTNLHEKVREGAKKSFEDKYTE